MIQSRCRLYKYDFLDFELNRDSILDDDVQAGHVSELPPSPCTYASEDPYLWENLPSTLRAQTRQTRGSIYSSPVTASIYIYYTWGANVLKVHECLSAIGHQVYSYFPTMSIPVDLEDPNHLISITLVLIAEVVNMVLYDICGIIKICRDEFETIATFKEYTPWIVWRWVMLSSVSNLTQKYTTNRNKGFIRRPVWIHGSHTTNFDLILMPAK